MAARRFVIAALRHETNTFSPVATPLGAFFGRFASAAESADAPLLAGDRALEKFAHTQSPFAGFVKVARAAGAQPSVPLFANASPSAPTERAAFDTMANAVLEDVRKGCDAVMLDLHGAMVVEGIDDAETELLRRIRSVAPEVPIAVALDFHGNIGEEMIRYATVITGYRTYPHVDTFETGERAGRTLLDALDGRVRPRLLWGRVPMLTHMNRQTPSRQPMKDIMDRAIAAEASREVLNASIFGGFPLADIPQACLSVVVVGEQGSDAAERLRDELLGAAWSRRRDFVFRTEPIAESIARARSLGEHPVVLADHGNNCGAGGSADAMDVVEEILRQGLEGVIAGPICDPLAVDAMIRAGVGSQITLPVGGRTDMPAVGLKARPLTLSGRVHAITDGRFTVTAPMFTGVTISMGRTAVLDTGAMKLVVSEDRVEPWDLGVFTHCGLDPARARYVLVQSRQHFRAGFEPIAKHIVMVSGPGVCTSDYERLAFRRLRRPIYPLDPDARWPD